jgi:hypothetical protein
MAPWWREYDGETVMINELPITMLIEVNTYSIQH